MPSPRHDRIAAAMDQLRTAELSKRNAIDALQALGALRSRGLVADLGEGLAAGFYDVELAPPSTPGYDLETKEGWKVQVRTLRDTATNHRTSMGVMKEPYDVLLAGHPTRPGLQPNTRDRDAARSSRKALPTRRTNVVDTATRTREWRPSNHC